MARAIQRLGGATFDGDIIMSHPAGDPMRVRLALAKANPKIIVCTRHRYPIGGRALDNIDQAFKAKYCDACPDRIPRPAGWTFYDEPS